jgi:hypothetical protein
MLIEVMLNELKAFSKLNELQRNVVIALLGVGYQFDEALKIASSRMSTQ